MKFIRKVVHDGNIANDDLTASIDISPAGSCQVNCRQTVPVEIKIDEVIVMNLKPASMFLNSTCRHRKDKRFGANDASR